MTGKQFEATVVRGKARREAAYATVRLNTGVEIGLVPGEVQGLHGASREDLSDVAVAAFGTGIHFPALDADLDVPALGRAKTAAKAAAARETGSRGGRPRKAGGS